jgi:hypothetical protein
MPGNMLCDQWFVKNKLKIVLKQWNNKKMCTNTQKIDVKVRVTVPSKNTSCNL